MHFKAFPGVWRRRVVGPWPLPTFEGGEVGARGVGGEHPSGRLPWLRVSLWLLRPRLPLLGTPLIPSGRLVLRDNRSVSRSVTLSHLRSALGPCEVTVTGSGFGWAHVGRRRQRGAQLVSLTLNPNQTIKGLGKSTT